MHTETQKPQDQKHHKNCPKHSHIPLLPGSMAIEFSSTGEPGDVDEVALTVFLMGNGQCCAELLTYFLSVIRRTRELQKRGCRPEVTENHAGPGVSQDSK